MDRNMKKHIIEIVAFAIILYCAITHLNVVWGFVCSVLGLLMPFILGGAIAFVVNVPMKQIEKYLFRNNQKLQTMKRTVSYILTLIVVAGILTLAMTVVIPELVRTAKALTSQVPAAVEAVQGWFHENAEKLPSVAAFIEESEFDIASISAKATDLLQSVATGILSSSFSLVGSVVSGIVSFLIGVVFSVYVLFQKEKLSVQAKKILYALLPEKRLISLYPELELACGELAGVDGFAYPEQLYGVKIPISEEEQQMVRDYIKETYRFTPSMVFVTKPFSFSQFVHWNVLKGQIPILMEKELDKIRRVTEEKRQRMIHGFL